MELRAVWSDIDRTTSRRHGRLVSRLASGRAGALRRRPISVARRCARRAAQGYVNPQNNITLGSEHNTVFVLIWSGIILSQLFEMVSLSRRIRRHYAARIAAQQPKKPFNGHQQH